MEWSGEGVEREMVSAFVDRVCDAAVVSVVTRSCVGIFYETIERMLAAVGGRGLRKRLRIFSHNFVPLVLTF